MIRITDRYILGNFIKTLIMTVFAFYAIVLIVDFVEKVDTFIDKQAAIKDVFLYFFYALPNFFNIILPISMLMASLFTMGQFVKYGELTALKSAGVSLYRIVLPVILFGLLLSGFSFWFGERVVTRSEREKSKIYSVNIRKVRVVKVGKDNIIIQDTNDRLVTIGHYDGKKHIGQNVNIQKRNKNQIYSTISARVILPYEGGWLLRDCKMRDFSSGEEVVTEFDEYRVSDFSFTEDDLVSVLIEPEEMNASELQEYIHKLRLIGSPFEHWLVDYHKKFSFPFANLIVVLLGLPLAIRNYRGGAAIGFGICLFITFMYYAIMTFTHALGYKGNMSPVTAAWFSNVLFGLVGIAALITAKK